MAYILRKQTLLDSNKRTVIKLCGSGDADDTGNLVVNVASLSNYKPVLQVNTGNLALVNIKTITYIINSPGNGSVELYWYGANANSTMVMLSKTGIIQFESDQMVITNDATGPNGDVWLKTTGFNTANSSFTIILDLRKDTRYFDPGYNADPAAFNR